MNVFLNSCMKDHNLSYNHLIPGILRLFLCFAANLITFEKCPKRSVIPIYAAITEVLVIRPEDHKSYSQQLPGNPKQFNSDLLPAPSIIFLPDHLNRFFTTGIFRNDTSFLIQNDQCRNSSYVIIVSHSSFFPGHDI